MTAINTKQPANDACIFCQIVAGRLPSHHLWEDEKHLAFLSIYPNTQGVTVVITKKHCDSYIFDNDMPTIQGLIQASQQVATLLERSFDSVGRVGVVFEGFGVNHFHVKLYPMHGTKGKWKPIESSRDTFYDTYPGYISSHDSTRASDTSLATLATCIRSKNSTRNKV